MPIGPSNARSTQVPDTMTIPLSPSFAGPSYDDSASMRHLWIPILAMGLVAVVIGVLAISAPHFATSATVVVVGVLLLIEGVAEVIHAVIVRHWRGSALHLLAAALYLMIGLFILEDRDRAASVLTLLLVAAFAVGGVLRIIFAAAVRFTAWGWVVANGVVDLVIVVLLLSGYPESTLWAIGLFVGLDLIFHGLSWVMLSWYARTLTAHPGPVG
jgi:uncharacterized membrane protein HdeD (DUF308 family)